MGGKPVPMSNSGIWVAALPVSRCGSTAPCGCCWVQSLHFCESHVENESTQNLKQNHQEK